MASAIGTGFASSTGSAEDESFKCRISCDWVGASGSSRSCEEAAAIYSDSVELPDNVSRSETTGGSPRLVDDGPAEIDGDVGEVGDAIAL